MRKSRETNLPALVSRPQIELTSVIPEFPEDGGLCFLLQGKKNQDFVAKNARIRLGEEAFWKALSEVLGKQVVSTFKLTMHPISTNSETLDLAKDVVKGQTEVNTRLTFGKGKMKKRTVIKKLAKFVEAGDPEFIIEAEHGDRRLTWKGDGTLFSFKLKASLLLKAEKERMNILAPPPAETKKPPRKVQEKKKSAAKLDRKSDSQDQEEEDEDANAEDAATIKKSKAGNQKHLPKSKSKSSRDKDRLTLDDNGNIVFESDLESDSGRNDEETDNENSQEALIGAEDSSNEEEREDSIHDHSITPLNHHNAKSTTTKTQNTTTNSSTGVLSYFRSIFCCWGARPRRVLTGT